MSTKIGLGVPVPQMLPVVGTWSFPFAAYFLLLSNRIVYHRLTKKQYAPSFLLPSPNPSLLFHSTNP